MELVIGDRVYQFDYDSEFSEKLSTLKKKSKITFRLSIYVYGVGGKNDDRLLQEQNESIKFITDLQEVPNSMYVAKSNFYWWCFDGCKLLDKTIKEDKEFYDYKGRDIKKLKIDLTVSFSTVYGSDKKSVIERNIKLNQLFGL